MNGPESQNQNPNPTPTATDPLDEYRNPPQPDPATEFFMNIVRFFWNVIRTVALTLRAIIFLVLKTPYMLIPSAAHTSAQDETYNDELRGQLTGLVLELDLDPLQKKVIIENWISQINWTNNRATRERDANELIRWWQIILGVLIPVIVNISPDVISQQAISLTVSLAGIFVAVLTAINQFRRPEERWRHYRVITERYQKELWNYITLSGDAYTEFSDHRAGYKVFNKRMGAIRQEDLTKFFAEVVPPTRSENESGETQTERTGQAAP